MEKTEVAVEPKRGVGYGAVLGTVFVLVLIAGGALSILAYQQNDLTALEAITAGFAGVGALIVGFFVAVLGAIIGFIGALVGLVATAGALALTAFLVGSPIIAIILFFLLMRRNRGCPDPAAHSHHGEH